MALTAISNPRVRYPAAPVEDAVWRSFEHPPATHGPVPFYWWAGERLDRTRIAWQLDQLRAKGVRQTIISYPHRPDGTCDEGDPAVFSAEWWDLFRWFLTACSERGMTVGFQDYTIIGPVLNAIGQDTPGMEGGRMSCVAGEASRQSPVRLEAEAHSIVVGAWAYPVSDGWPRVDAAICLTGSVAGGVLEWTPEEDGPWRVALVFARPSAFDPLHPDSGALAISRLYAPFEIECPGELGRTLNLFFQDELDFGARMPFWSNHLFDAFLGWKGYDLRPLLPALWHDLGAITEKVRLDFADVVTRRVEECYFKPVFRWHAERGILFGHDNSGRGGIAEGRSHYGDYFRTMRWYSAPGCDDPKLDGARAFRGLKVNSSIAHLYRRPRVWVEAFHSSGWGIAPAEIIAALNEDFAYGATVVNLHGLYYSTRGGWWEWAPPDFHFRQPYWKHAAGLNRYITRVCWLLSQGVHRCDVAIVYPVAALDVEPADPAVLATIAHTGNDEIATQGEGPSGPEEAAFGIGRHLFDRGCDFDFIDCDSLERAATRDGLLEVADAAYRVLVFPAMHAVRMPMIEKARDFVRAGGLVIAFGCLPVASDEQGRGDPRLMAMIGEILGSTESAGDLCRNHPGGGTGRFIRSGYGKVFDAIDSSMVRAVDTSVPLQVLRRRLDDQDVYFICNPAKKNVTSEIRFTAASRLEQWDAWTAAVTPVPESNVVTATFGPGEARIFVSRRTKGLREESAATGIAVSRTERLEGLWESIIHPSLDNRFGDFSLPATPGMLGPQARRFRYSDETCEDTVWMLPGFDDGSWPETTFSFGPRLESSGPISPDADFAEIERALLGGGGSLEWRPYAISRRWGIEQDPFLTDWLSGPHGLKGTVPDEYLDFHSDVVGTVWYVRAKVVVPAAGEHLLVSGGRCAHQVWLNGETVAMRREALGPGRHAPWNIPHYDCEPAAARVALRAGSNELLVKLVQPNGQRTRAFVAFDPAPQEAGELALRWFARDDVPRPALLAAADRRAIRFRFKSPPGLRAFEFVSRGSARAWVGGREVRVVAVAGPADGLIRCRVLVDAVMADPQDLAIRVEAPADSHAGDALPEPVAFECGAGVLAAGDWCSQGLATYSGAVEYRRTLHLPEPAPGASVHLDLGSLSATAEVRLNGSWVATLVVPPWRCDLTAHLRRGDNDLSVTVANTLANHYSVGIPSPYASVGRTTSGLFGPVTLVTTS